MNQINFFSMPTWTCGSFRTRQSFLIPSSLEGSGWGAVQREGSRSIHSVCNVLSPLGLLSVAQRESNHRPSQFKLFNHFLSHCSYIRTKKPQTVTLLVIIHDFQHIGHYNSSRGSLLFNSLKRLLHTAFIIQSPVLTGKYYGQNRMSVSWVWRGRHSWKFGSSGRQDKKCKNQLFMN